MNLLWVVVISGGRPGIRLDGNRRSLRHGRVARNEIPCQGAGEIRQGVRGDGPNPSSASRAERRTSASGSRSASARGDAVFGVPNLQRPTAAIRRRDASAPPGSLIRTGLTVTGPGRRRTIL